MGWDRVRHGSGTRALLACSGGPSAARDGRIEGRRDGGSPPRAVDSVALCRDRQHGHPGPDRSSAQPCAPPPRPPPPRPPFRLVLRLLLRGCGAPLLRSPPGQHRQGIHDHQHPPAARASGHLAPTANRRPGPAPAASLSQWRVRSAAAGSFRLESDRALQAGRVEPELNNRRGRG